MENNFKSDLSIRRIELHVGDSIQIDLPGLGSAGYQWTYDPDTGNILKIEKKTVSYGELKPGESVAESFMVTGLRKGESTIVFKQMRSWEKDKEPIDRATYKIIVE